MRNLLILLALVAASAAGQPAPAPGVERSALFRFDAGDRIDDADVMNVSGGRFDRRETFEFVTRADGSRVLTSVTVGAGDLYRVDGRWQFTGDDVAVSADGIGSYAGESVTMAIRRDGDMAEISVDGAAVARHRAWCADDCLLDMSPSALAMFTMTRRYVQSQGGIRV